MVLFVFFCEQFFLFLSLTDFFQFDFDLADFGI